MSRRTLEYTLVPDGRISAGKAAQISNLRTIHTIIPGSAIRGALGTAWWSSPTAAFRPSTTGRQQRFNALFERALEVHSAFPYAAGPHSAPPTFRPASVVECKYANDGCLIEHDRAGDPRPHGSPRECPSCHSALKEGRGWFVPPEFTTTATRTALVGGVAKSEQLFSRDALRSSIILRGRVVIRDDANLDEEIAWLMQEKVLRVGGQLSTMGRCTWSLVEMDEQPPPTMPDRVAVRLLSPAILVDAFGRPSLDLGVAVRGQSKVERQWVRPVRIAGWHGLAGFAKSEDWAVDAGGTVLLSGCTADDIAAIRHGIGLRRLEGFGQVDVADATTLPRDVRQGTRVAPAAEPEPETPRAAYELASMVEEPRRASALRAMLSAARQLQRMRDNGFPESMVRQQVPSVLGQPWARDLGPETRVRLQDLLESGDLRQAIADLESMLASAR